MTDTTPPATPPAAPPPATPVAGPPKVLSLIGMIAGIVGIVFSLFLFGAGIVFSIGAVVLGFLGKSREGLPAKGFWLTALITGFAGIAVALIVWIISAIIAFAFIGGAAEYSTY